MGKSKTDPEVRTFHDLLKAFQDACEEVAYCDDGPPGDMLQAIKKRDKARWALISHVQGIREQREELRKEVKRVESWSDLADWELKALRCKFRGTIGDCTHEDNLGEFGPCEEMKCPLGVH